MRISDWSSDVCPSDLIDAEEERAWAAEWVAAILAREKVYITPDVKEHVWSALDNLASAPKSERRSAERRAGNECVSPCRSRWSQDHEKKHKRTHRAKLDDRTHITHDK